MVEEHSTNFSSRIDPEYSSSLPAPVLSPSCQKQADLKLSERTDSATASDKPDSSVAQAQPSANAEQKDASCDLDVKTTIDHKKDTFKTSRPNSIESKRSKSLGNASSVDSSEDSKSKKDVKKTKSNPVKIDNASQEAAAESKELSMTAEESLSPGRNASSEAKSSERSESPKPGCSSQQDLGMYNKSIINPQRDLLFIPDSSSPRSPRSSEGIREELCALLPSPSGFPKPASALRRLRQENEKLQAEVTRLRRLVVSGATSVLAEKRTPTEGCSDPTGKVQALEMELQLAKEALIS